MKILIGYENLNKRSPSPPILPLTNNPISDEGENNLAGPKERQIQTTLKKRISGQREMILEWKTLEYKNKSKVIVVVLNFE